MLIFTNSYPCVLAHCFNKDFDRNQCQAMDNATQQTAINAIIMFFSLNM